MSNKFVPRKVSQKKNLLKVEVVGTEHGLRAGLCRALLGTSNVSQEQMKRRVRRKSTPKRKQLTGAWNRLQSDDNISTQ